MNEKELATKKALVASYNKSKKGSKRRVAIVQAINEFEEQMMREEKYG